ncbi:MAG: hypothetical protein AAGA75_12395 [Cyanobacteria bacterium P01_E01_bin.6]
MKVVQVEILQNVADTEYEENNAEIHAILARIYEALFLDIPGIQPAS